METITKKNLSRVIVITLIAVLLVSTCFTSIVDAGEDPVDRSGRVELTNFAVNIKDNTWVNADVSKDEKENTVFTIEDTLYEDYESLRNASAFPKVRFDANAVRLQYNSSYGGYIQFPGFLTLSGGQFNQLNAVVKPYDTDPNYIIAEFSVYREDMIGDIAGQYKAIPASKTDFTLRFKKWESQYSPEQKPHFLNTNLWVGHRNANGTWQSDVVRIFSGAFSPIAGTPYTYEYVAAKGVTYPYSIDIMGTPFFRTTCYIDGIRISGNEAAKGIERRLTFTAKKPYVDIKIVPDASLDTKHVKYKTSTWRLRVNGTSSQDSNTGSPTSGILTDRNGQKVSVIVAGIKDKAWNGKKIKPNPVVTRDGKKLIKGKDYTLSYGANKNIGKGAVKIIGKGNYKGTITTLFKIVPKAPKGLNLTSSKKMLKTKWTKSPNFKKQKIKGYQVQYRYKNGSSWTSWKSKEYKVSYKGTTKTISKKIKKLKAKKKYQVRVRAYKTVSGKKYYSKWSGIKSKKTK